MPSLLALLLCATLAQPTNGFAAETPAASQPLRLYTVATPSPAAGWSLRILPNRRRPSGSGVAYIRVLVQRKDKARLEGLLLSVSARDPKGKAVSREKAVLAWERGQLSNEAFFKIESPDCLPVTVVAALSAGLEPLARQETRLTFKCAP